MHHEHTKRNLEEPHESQFPQPFRQQQKPDQLLKLLISTVHQTQKQLGVHEKHFIIIITISPRLPDSFQRIKVGIFFFFLESMKGDFKQKIGRAHV